MKTLPALALALSFFASAAQAQSENVSSFSVYGIAAVAVYDALDVEATLPEAGVPGGINPLQGSKLLETEGLTISCELRLFSKTCSFEIEAASVQEDGSLYLAGANSLALYDVLNVEVVQGPAGRPDGINPLQGKKSLKSEDGQISISCAKRLFGTTCLVENQAI